MTHPRQTPCTALALLAASLTSFSPLPAAADSTISTDASALDAPASDEDDDPRTRAMEAYARGTELYNAAEFEQALAAFEEAATLYASPDFQFNIGKCYERLGKYEQAIRHFETYLRTSEDPPDRAVVENSIADLKARLEADAKAAEEAQQQQQVAPPPEPEEEPPPSGKPLLIAGAALVGVGVAAGLGGGLAFGIPVSRDNRQLGEVLDGNPEGLTFAEADAIASRARANQTLEIVMIGVGGAVVVVGAALLAVGVKRNEAASPAASLRLSPSWSRSGAGLTLQGEF